MEYFILIIVLGLAYTTFLPDKGIFSRWRKNKTDREKVFLEDTLKHIYDCEYKGVTYTVETISNHLLVSSEKTQKILNKLESLNFLTILHNDIHLTTEGRAYALRIVRVHRLWEKYLAERTSLDSTIWHTQADELEHKITASEADSLAAKMGNPLFDPHGDPIPTSEGKLPLNVGKLLVEMEEGEYGQINHIEDEPEKIYSQIAERNLYPGQHIQMIKKTDEKIIFRANGEECLLPPEIASNISVVEFSKSEKPLEKYETLVSLNSGEEGEVIGIAKSCRGQQRRRLMDLGVVPGSIIKAELKSIGGNPVAYNIRGALIALRRENAQQIFIKKTNEVKYNVS